MILVPARLALPGRAAEPAECFVEERLDVVRLQAPRFGPLHLLADAVHAAGVHRVMGELLLLQQVLYPVPVEGMVDRRVQSRAHLGLLAVPDRVDQQLAQRPPLELQLAEHVEDLPAQRLPRLLQLFEQPPVDVSLAGLLRHEVPEMADLGLADPVDAAEPLLQPVGVPGQVVVDHQVRPLQVDPFAGGVGGQQHRDLRIVPERLLRLEPLFPPYPAVDHHDRSHAAKQRRDPVLQIPERVAVFGEKHELLARRRRRPRDLAGSVRRRPFPDAARQPGRREDLAEQARELPPLRVAALLPDTEREALQLREGLDLRLQLDNRAGGSRLVQKACLGGLDLVLRCVLEVVYLVGIQRGRRQDRRGVGRSAPLEHLELPAPVLQSLPPPAQRPVDRLGRRRQPPLENRQRKADGAGPPGVGERLGAVELLPHVIGDGGVEAGLRLGQRVRDGIGDPLREERLALERQQVLLHHPPHQVRHVGRVDPVAEPPLEPVAVEQGHEELEILLLPVVRRRRHQQEVAAEARQQLAQPVALRVGDLAPEERRRQLVGLIADDKIPPAVRRLQLGLQILVARQHVQARDDQRRLQKPVPGACRFQLVAGQNLERQVKPAVQLVLPLLGEASGTDHEAAFQIAAGDQLLDQQARHDRLARARVVGEEETQRLPRQHRLVDCGDLVRQRFEIGRVDRQHGIEEMRHPDALRLGHQPKQRAVAVEAPRPAAFDDLQPRLVVAVQQFVRHRAGRCLVRQLESLGAEPLHADDGDQRVGEHAADGGMGLEIFESHGSRWFTAGPHSTDASPGGLRGRPNA